MTATLWNQTDGDWTTWLRQQSAITAFVGTGTAARIFHGRPKTGPNGRQPQTPYLIYGVVEGDNYWHMGGDAGLHHTTIHVYAMADAASQAQALALAVQSAVEAWRTQYMGNTWIEMIKSTLPDDGSDPPQDASGQFLFWSRIICEFVHSG